MLKERNVQITIARKTFPALRATAMRDFFNVLRGMGAYKEEWHNKSENIYHYAPSGSEVDFISVDEPTRVRSRRRNYLWLNEGNEFLKDDYMQLAMRTDRQIFMDFNPSHMFHWIYDDIEPRKDCVIIQSTYKDNPFLPAELVKEIENYKNTDQNYWRIYGLGLKGMAETLIYTHWRYCEKLPENPDKIYYGLDFGYNNQTALVRIDEKDKDFYWRELIYQRYLTNQDLIEKLKELVKDGEIKYIDTIYGDNAEPARIEEISQSGFNILPCIKLQFKDEETRGGINIIKSHGFYITKDSVNLQKEAKTYSWKEKDGKPLEEPVKENDHLLSAGRYAIISEMGYAPSPFPDQDKKEMVTKAGIEKGEPDSAGFMGREF